MQRETLQKEYFEKNDTDTFTKKKIDYAKCESENLSHKKGTNCVYLVRIFLLVIIVSFLFLDVSES